MTWTYWKILEENDRIDVMINSAGVGGAQLNYTKDGLELHFATNHIGHFFLTNLLMPALKKSDEPRVVNVSSGAYAYTSGGESSCLHFFASFPIAGNVYSAVRPQIGVHRVGSGGDRALVG